MAPPDPNIVYAFPDKPADGDCLPLAPGVWWLRMALPFALNHINLWLLEDGDNWVTVDTGIDATETRATWERVFSRQMSGRPVSQVIATHLHPDHVGLAGWLSNQWHAPLLMSRQEYLSARMLASDQPPPPDVALDFYRQAGLSDAQMQTYKARFGRYGQLVSPLPQAYRRLSDGMELEIGQHRWEVVVGRGHSPEHACLYSAALNMLIAGDQVLPTISPNVSVWPTEPGANPLDDWLRSCRELPSRLPDDVLVLPSHGRPFRGLRARMLALIEEHETGLQKVRELCAQPQRAVDTFATLFRGAVGDSTLVLAAGEAMAHMNYLEQCGELQVEPDVDGVRWYTRR